MKYKDSQINSSSNIVTNNIVSDNDWIEHLTYEFMNHVE